MIEISVDPRRIVRLILGVIVVLTVVHLSLKIYRYYHPLWADPACLWRLFNTSGYGNIPRYFRALLLLTASFLFYTVSYAKRAMRDRFTGHWTALAIIFLYLSIDDAASIHELGSKITIPWLRDTGIQPYAWAVIALGFVTVFGLTFYRFVNQLPARTRRLFITAGATYVLGACGMEITKGILIERMPAPNALVGLVRTSKQTLEALGNTLLIYALLSYIASHIGSFHIDFRLDGKARDSKARGDLSGATRSLKR